MKIRRRNLLIVIGFAIAAVLLLALWREREPRYEGKSLSQWMATIDRGGALEAQEKGEQAIRQIGTNGTPFLLRWIQYQERPWRTHVANFCGRLPGKPGEIAYNFIHGNGQQRQSDAFNALYTLGPLAEPAIPILTKQLREPTPISDPAASILVHIGDAALPPILTIITNAAESPTLRQLLINNAHFSWTQFTQTNLLQSALVQCLDDQNFEVAVSAAGVICNHKPQHERAMRVLTRGVESAMKRPHQIAVRYIRAHLGKIPTDNVLRYLQDTNSPFSPYAAEALGELAQKEPSPQSFLPALTNALHDPRPQVRSSCANALGDFGAKAEPAVCALLDALSDSDLFVRSAATNSLFRIPAYAIFRDLAMMEQYGIRPSAADIHYRGFFNYPPGPPLSRLMEHPDPRIRQMATNAFQKLRQNNSQNQR